MINLLNKIILSDNVVDNFYKEYKNNADFKNWLDNTIPEITQCEKQQQNNPWHKYNVLGHILHSVEAMNNMTKDLSVEDRRVLAYTMLFHDIGKPKKHITRLKNGKNIDSFFDHNIESAKIAKEKLPKLGFEKDDVAIIEKLVYKHDIFMYIKDRPTNNPYWKVLTNELILDEIDDLSSVGDGYKLMKYLIMVGKADSLAQNEKMTAESLALHDKMFKIINNLEQTKNI